MNGGNRNIGTHNTKCPLCTSILTQPKRVRAMRENVKPILEMEAERDRLLLILWGILREHGGQLTLRTPPSEEEMEGHPIDYDIDNDGTLRISLPSDVIVEAGTLIRTGR